jgi:hypothetical protein
MKLERKNLTASYDAGATLNHLERTMLASIALMKRLRKQNRQLHRREAGSAGEQPAAQS